MQLQKPKIPSKYRPRGFDILHEDLDLIAVNKESGVLSVAALWNRDKTVHSALNNYLQKGNSRSKKEVFVVHRIDQATSGVLLFAKNEQAQTYLKNNWSKAIKTYYAVVQGVVKKKQGLIESYLSEDEDYVVHSSQNSDSGKLARTEYQVVKETENFSVVKVNLHTGKKNQIRVHMAEIGNPIIGDEKYGAKAKAPKLLLHAYSLEVTHPFKQQRILFTAELPEHFLKWTGQI